MTDILNTGKTALFAFSRALATTSHNIANVNTEGYSRQRVDLEAVGSSHGHYVGSGVNVVNVERVHDQFATARVNAASSSYMQQQTHYEMASRLDNLVASDGISISPALNEFFNAVQDANNDASSIASREVVLERAEQLAYQFRTIQGQFDDTQYEVNERMRTSAETLSNYAQSIADINQQVITLTGSQQAHASNDLIDQREKLLGELSEYIDVDTLVQDDGTMSVYISNGLALVMGVEAQQITTSVDDTDTSQIQFMVGNPGNERKLSTSLIGGQIGGLVEFANQTLHPAMQELGRLALVMTDKINDQHSRGIDLNNDSGKPLFEIGEPRALSSRNNTGTGALSAAISNTDALIATDYQLRYDGANFIITRTSDGKQSTGALPISIDGIDLSITGTPDTGDTFVLSAANHVSDSMNVLIGIPDELALSGQLSSVSDIQNLGEARIGNPKVLDPDNTSLRDPIEILFTSDSTYDIVDTNTNATLVNGATYTPGTAISLNGWEVSISGVAAEGDSHQIGPNYNGHGNNNNGMSLADLQFAPVIGGIQSFTEAYGSMISRVGARTRSAQSSASAMEALRDNAIERQQAVQGVSLDEEAIDLTRYQQAYQASAQIIATADELFQTILGAIR